MVFNVDVGLVDVDFLVLELHRALSAREYSSGAFSWWEFLREIFVGCLLIEEGVVMGEVELDLFIGGVVGFAYWVVGVVGLFAPARAVSPLFINLLFVFFWRFLELDIFCGVSLVLV